MSAAKMTADLLLSMMLDDCHMLDGTGPNGEKVLTVTLDPWLLEELAAHGADDREDNGDHEPNVVAPEGAHYHFRHMDEPDHEQTTVREWRSW